MIKQTEHYLYSDLIDLPHGFSLKGAITGNTWNGRRSFFKPIFPSKRILFVSVEQVHGANVVEFLKLQSKTYSELGQADGIVYKKKKQSKKVCLFIKTADCVPILFADKTNGVIAVAHSGWKGTKENIVNAAISKMVAYGANVRRINIIIGPSIGSCCYFISDERASLFPKKYIEHMHHQLSLNLVRMVYDQVCEAGISPSQIDYKLFCTSCQESLFESYRRDGQNRPCMVNFISI